MTRDIVTTVPSTDIHLWKPEDVPAVDGPNIHVVLQLASHTSEGATVVINVALTRDVAITLADALARWPLRTRSADGSHAPDAATG